MKRPLVLHPFLFTLYAVMALFVNNITQVNLSSLRSLLLAVLGAIILMVVMRLLLKDAVKAGLVSSGLIVLVFSYGHVETLTQNWASGDVEFWQSILLVLIWIALFVFWLYGVLIKWQNLDVISNYLNWVSLILNVFPIYTLIIFTRQSKVVKPLIPEFAAQVRQESGVINMDAHHASGNLDRPDIYYIILDAYTRADVLDMLYDYDNRYFIQALEARGFYVADASQANYTDTVLSITSSLNMVHLSTMSDFFRQNANTYNDWIVNDVCNYMMNTNNVTEFLKAQGYHFVTYKSGYAKTIIARADEYYSPPEYPELNNQGMMFDMMLLDTSLGQIYTRLRGNDFAPLQALFDAHRTEVIFALESIPDIALMEGDYFVFAHIVSPHTPFVFGPNGEEINGVDPFTLMDMHPGQEENIRLYRDQVHYLNTVVLEMIDRILENSATPPIILIQGDHSSKVFNQLEPPSSVRMQLLFPILNAYHFPEGRDDRLYPSITPVNSFRVIFDEFFGTELDLLPDRSYLLEAHRDLAVSGRGKKQFLDACDTYNYCIP